MFKKKKEFGGGHLLDWMAMGHMKNGDPWSSAYSDSNTGKDKTIHELAVALAESYDEIDRLEELQPKENPKVDVVGYSQLYSLPNGVYEFSSPGPTAITLLKTGDGLYPNGKLDRLFTFDFVARNYSHYQLLYEFPKEKKEYEIKGHFVVPTVIKVTATSKEEAKAYAKENNDKPWAEVDVLSPTAKYYNGEYNEDPFAD